MSPQISAVAYAPIQWDFELYHPVKPGTTPTGDPAVSAVGGAGMNGYASWPYGQADSTFSPQSSTFAGAGKLVCCTEGVRWCKRNSAAASTAGAIGRWNQYSPAIDTTTCPSPEDPGQRILWLRLFALSGGTVASVADCIGFALCPDDGRAAPSTQWPPALATAFGGFGIFKRTGAGGLRYASYSAGGVLLEAINLCDNTAGWHTVDFIIRQAKRGDASTPWLTLRFDGVTQFSERPFGHALLQAPTAVAGAHGWGWYSGIAPNSSGLLSHRYVVRVGSFHPDGYPQP